MKCLWRINNGGYTVWREGTITFTNSLDKIAVSTNLIDRIEVDPKDVILLYELEVWI